MDINKKKLIVDGISLFTLLVITISGIILWLVLPGKTASSGASFIFARNTWKLMHLWGSLIFIISIISHHVLNWEWIKYEVFKKEKINEEDLNRKNKLIKK